MFEEEEKQSKEAVKLNSPTVKNSVSYAARKNQGRWSSQVSPFSSGYTEMSPFSTGYREMSPFSKDYVEVSPFSPNYTEASPFASLSMDAVSAPVQMKALNEPAAQSTVAAQSPVAAQQIRDPYSGTPLQVSDELSESIEDSFGIDTDELSLRESPEVSKMGARATAQGDVIRFAPGAFNPNTRDGLSVLGHELNHVREQAVCNVQPNVDGTNIHYDQGHEAASDRAGDAFASGTLAGTGQINVGGMSAETSPIQGWGVGGFWPRLFGKNQILQGEHELLTRTGVDLANAKLTTDRRYSKEDLKALEYGTRFNDVYNSGTGFVAGVDIYYNLDAFLNQSHKGDMQFLHAMRASDTTVEDKEKQMRWAEFALDTYQNQQVGAGSNIKTFQQQNMLDYVLKGDDLFQEMMMSTMVEVGDMKRIDENIEEMNIEDPEVRREIRMEMMRRTLTELNDTDKVEFDKYASKGHTDEELLKYEEKLLNQHRSKYAGMDIAQFFQGGNKKLDAGMIALGSMFHMLEDSFADSHAQRTFNSKSSAVQPDRRGIDITNFDTIEPFITPIMLHGDYSEQDSKRHTKADYLDKSKWQKNGGKSEEQNAIDNTEGAYQAQSVVAHLLYRLNNETTDNGGKIGYNELKGTLSQVLDVVDIGSVLRDFSFNPSLSTTVSGRQYQTGLLNDAEQNNNALIDDSIEYENLLATQERGNIIRSTDDKILHYEQQVVLLKNILEKAHNPATRENVRHHLTEILLNALQIKKEAPTNQIDQLIKHVSDAIKSTDVILPDEVINTAGPMSSSDTHPITSEKMSIGTKVTAIARGNAASDGSQWSAKEGVIGYVGRIISGENIRFPYRIDSKPNGAAVDAIGWYREEDLRIDNKKTTTELVMNDISEECLQIESNQQTPAERTSVIYPDEALSSGYNQYFSGRYMRYKSNNNGQYKPIYNKKGYSNIGSASFNLDYRWFFGDNTEYNKDLSLVSSIISADAYAPSRDNKGDDVQFLMSERLGSEKSTASLLRALGFVDTEDISVGYSDNALDNDCTDISVGHRFIEYDGKKKEIILVAVRGTNGTIAEWSSNMDPGADTENYPSRNHPEWKNKSHHKGFDVTANRVIDAIEKYINKSNDIRSDAEKVFWITGHSRGGAIANLLGAYYEDQGVESYTYTYAAPRTVVSDSVTDKQPKDYNTIFNVINKDDLIPNLPLGRDLGWGFELYGRDLTFSAKDSLVDKSLGQGSFQEFLGWSYQNTDIDKILKNFSDIANSREQIYAYNRNDKDTRVSYGFFVNKKEANSAKERVEKIHMERYPTMHQYCEFAIIELRQNQFEVVMYQTPAYFMQFLSVISGSGTGEQVGLFQSGSLGGGTATIAKLAKKYRKAFRDFASPGVRGKFNDPHYPETYTLAVKNDVLKEKN